MRAISRIHVLGLAGLALAVIVPLALADDDQPAEKKPAAKAVPALRLVPATPAAKEKGPAAGTHEQIKEIVVKGEKGNALQTICPGADGQPLATWTVKFTAQSLNTGPDGSVFVAGDGRIAKFSKDGKVIAETEVPHLAKVLADTDTLRQKAAARGVIDGEFHRELEEALWRLLRAETSCHFFWGESWVPRCHRDLNQARERLDRLASTLAASEEAAEV